MEAEEQQAIADIFFAAHETRRQSLIQQRLDKLAGVHAPPKPEVKTTWEYMNSDSWETITKRALELGWAENKVQIKKYYLTPEVTHYYIEPYEQDCDCPNLVRYEDYADGSVTTDA